MISSDSSDHAAWPFQVGVSLDEIVRQLSGALRPVDVVPNPTQVKGATVWDSDGGDATRAGMLVLLPSWSLLSTSQLAAAAESVRKSGASGLIVRGLAEAESQLSSICASLDLPLLELDSSYEWRHFDALLSRLLGEHGAGLHVEPSTSDRLFALANTVASAFGGSVSIEDHRRNVIAYSARPGQAIDELRANVILYRRAPDHPINEIRYRQIHTQPGINRFPQHDDDAPRVAIAIHAGAIPLGSIWAIDPAGHDLSLPLSAEKSDSLETAADLAATFLIDAWRSSRGEGYSKEQAFGRLLAGSPHADDLGALGISPAQPVVLAALVVADDHVGDAELREITSSVSRHLAVYFPGTVCALVDGSVFAIIPVADVDVVVPACVSLVKELEKRYSVRCHIGLGDSRLLRESIVARRPRTQFVAECARQEGNDVATVSAHVPQLIFAEVAGAALSSDLVLPEVEALLAPSETQSRATLLAWCEEQGSAPRIAVRLNLHEQTVRHRIRRLVQRFDLKLDDPDRLLALWLLLRISPQDTASTVHRSTMDTGQTSNELIKST